MACPALQGSRQGARNGQCKQGVRHPAGTLCLHELQQPLQNISKRARTAAIVAAACC